MIEHIGNVLKTLFTLLSLNRIYSISLGTADLYSSLKAHQY